MFSDITQNFKSNPTVYYALSICATWAGIGSLMNGVTMTQTYGIIPSLIWVFGNVIACILFGTVAQKIPKVREVFGSKIMALEDERYREVLQYRYINEWSWDKIAREMHYSPDWVWELHGKALLGIDRRLKEPSKTQF